VELTKRTHDGGQDVIAIRRKEVNVKFVIECRRPEPGRPVRVSAVRELLGVKTDSQASKAILATTTYFTSNASAFFERHHWELEPRDFDDVRAWIAEYLKCAEPQMGK
jgi:HJR/Mrr/RecB family endonuclease